MPLGLPFRNSTFCPYLVFMCFVWISEQTAIISLYNINWLVCITETESVYCAVRTGSLYIILRSAHTAVFMCFVWIWEQTAIISLYSTNWLVFICETESVYCAVRTDSLNIIDVTFVLQSVKCSSDTSFHSVILQLLRTFPHILYVSGLILHVSWFDKIAVNPVRPLAIPAFLSTLLLVLDIISSVLFLSWFVEVFQSWSRSIVIFSAICP